MAIAITYKGGTATTTNAASYALGTCTPSGNALLVLMGFVSTTVTSPGSVTGWGLPWTNGTTFLMNGGADAAYLFYAQAGASPGNGTATLFVTGDNGAGAAVMLWEVTGADTVTPVRQLKTALGTTGSPVVTLGTAPLATSGLIGAYGMNRGTPSGTAPSGWDATDFNAGYTTPSAGGVGGHDASPGNGTVITFTSPTSGTVGVMVVEINVAATIATGSLIATLGAATLVSAGTIVWGPITGTLDKTLANAALSASGQIPANGNLDKTLAAAILTATATIPAKGSLDKTLGAATMISTGTVGNAIATGQLNVTLANATVITSAQTTSTGSLSKTLANAMLVSTGAVSWGAPISGSLNVTLSNATVAATGQLIIKGVFVETLANATLISNGNVPIYGALISTLADATLTANGTSINGSTGTLVRTLEDATLISVGTCVSRDVPYLHKRKHAPSIRIIAGKVIVYE